jgi:hypothetical protein
MLPAAAIACALTYGASARAQTTTPKAPAGATSATEATADEPRDWALVIGFHLSGGFVGGAAGAGSLGALGAMPALRGALERRVADSLWLFFAASGGATQSFSETPGNVQEQWSWRGAGDVGLRHALSDPEPIELSWFGGLRASYARDVLVDQASLRSGGLAAFVGLSLDKHFNDWFALRARVDLLRAGFDLSGGDGQQAHSYTTWSIDAMIEPEIAVRFAF